MKIFKFIFSFFIVIMLCSAFTTAEKDNKKVYMFGVSASFADSLVYFTDVQLVEGDALENGVLKERSQYSTQLKEYLENQKGLKNRTCFIYFSEKKSALEKKLKSVKEKYDKNKSVLVTSIKNSDFKFKKPAEEE